MKVLWKDHTGIDEAQLLLQCSRGESAKRELLESADNAQGVTAFANHAFARSELERSTKWLSAISQGITDVLVIGIGGSTLASKAVVEALRMEKQVTTVRFLESVDREAHE